MIRYVLALFLVSSSFAQVDLFVALSAKDIYPTTIPQIEVIHDFLKSESTSTTIISTLPAPPEWVRAGPNDGLAFEQVGGPRTLFWTKEATDSESGDRWVCPVRYHKNSCPRCLYDGVTSRVEGGCYMTTLMAGHAYYDEEGNYHSHDPNTSHGSMTCSRGHTWGVSEGPSPCWVRGCPYGKRRP